MADRSVFADAGRRGARKRWGPPRVIRLDSLTPDQQRFVLAVWEAARTAPEKVEPEGHGNDRPAA